MRDLVPDGVHDNLPHSLPKEFTRFSNNERPLVIALSHNFVSGGLFNGLPENRYAVGQRQSAVFFSPRGARNAFVEAEECLTRSEVVLSSLLQCRTVSVFIGKSDVEAVVYLPYENSTIHESRGVRHLFRHRADRSHSKE